MYDLNFLFQQFSEHYFAKRLTARFGNLEKHFSFGPLSLSSSIKVPLFEKLFQLIDVRTDSGQWARQENSERKMDIRACSIIIEAERHFRDAN